MNKCSDLGGWEKIFNFRPKESLNLDGIVDYSYEKYYDVPIEYEKTFGREKRLATKPNPDGQSVLPVFCWMRPEYCNVSRSQKEIDDDKHWKEYEVKALTETHDSQECTPELEALIKLFKEANPYQEPNPYPDPYHIGSHGNRGVLSESEVGEIAVRLPKDFWVYFLNQNPRAAMAFAKKYGVGNVWATFTIYDWKIAIENRTEFVNEICSFEGHDDFADALLSAWPGFLDHLGYLPKEYSGQLDADDWFVECRVWSFLIRQRPDLAVHMTWEDWKRFSENDWKCLLHPRWRYIERAKVPMDGGHWWLCLSKAPQFATLCEQYGGWDKLSNHFLCDLLNKHADLVEYCVKHLKWDELTPDNWLALFKQENESEMLINKCDKHNGWEKFSTRRYDGACLEWVHLLKSRPQLADKCEIIKGWLKFNGGDWQVLLCAQPQLAGHCDSANGWKLLDEGDWMRLINRQPHFVAKYNEVHTSMGIETQTDATVVEKAREFVKRERRRIERQRFLREFDEHCGDIL